MARTRCRRRPLLLLLILGAVAAVLIRRRQSATSPATATPTTSSAAWPPFEATPARDAEPAACETVAPADSPPAASAPVDDTPAGNAPAAAPFADVAATAARWVAPVDGACPPGYPVKANDNSGIYHLPGGRFYARTVPERCYAAAEDAEADGYRRAKA